MGGRSQSGTCSSDEEYEVCTRIWSCIIWKAHSLSVVCQVENSYYKKQWKDSSCSSTSYLLYWQKWTMKSPAPWWLPAYSYGSDLCPCLNEHLEGWAVNQALRVVLLNNYLLPKDCDFSLDFFIGWSVHIPWKWHPWLWLSGSWSGHSTAVFMAGAETLSGLLGSPSRAATRELNQSALISLPRFDLKHPGQRQLHLSTACLPLHSLA